MKEDMPRKRPLVLQPFPSRHVNRRVARPAVRGAPVGKNYPVLSVRIETMGPGMSCSRPQARERVGDFANTVISAESLAGPCPVRDEREHPSRLQS